MKTKDRYFKYITFFYVSLMGTFQIADKLYGSAFMLYMNHYGLSLVTIGIMLGIQDFILVLVDFPSGVISDYIGRKRTTGISLIIHGGSIFLFAMTGNAIVLLISLIVMAVGMALFSGSPQAWYYDEMIKHGKKEYREKLLPKMGSYIILFSCLGAAISIMIQDDFFRIPLYTAAILLIVIGILFLFLFDDNKGASGEINFFAAFKNMSIGFIKNNDMRKITAQELINNVGYCVFLLLWQLNLVEKYNFPGKYISLVLIILMLAMSWGFRLCGYLSKKYDIKKISIIANSGLVLSFMLLLLSNNIIIYLLGIIFFEIFTGIDQAAKGIWHNDYIESENRASYYSAISAIKSLAGIFTFSGVGYLAEIWNYHIGWLVALLFQIIGLVLLYSFYKNKMNICNSEGDIT